jgi:hypothetical protein
LDSFKKEDNEDLLPGEGDESGGESETDTATASESDSTILPEIPFQAVQDNNSSSNISVARPVYYVPKEKSEAKLLREAMDNQMIKLGLNKFK